MRNLDPDSPTPEDEAIDLRTALKEIYNVACLTDEFASASLMSQALATIRQAVCEILEAYPERNKTA